MEKTALSLSETGRLPEPGAASTGRPRMVDVAEVAGVSLKTVSRVINEEPGVVDATRERVRAAIAQLGYRVNGPARALASHRSGAIGIITEATAHFGPTTQFLGLERAVWAAGYSVVVASLKTRTAPEFSLAVDRLLDTGVDGLLINGSNSRPVSLAQALPADVPTVSVGDPPTGNVPADANLLYAYNDQAAGAGQAVRHLLDLGHRAVHHLAGPLDWVPAQLRLAAWQRTLRTAGVPEPAPEYGDWSAQSGYEAGRRLLARPDVTAVFAANDQMAIGLLRAAAEAHRSVPATLSVIGFDDIPEASYLPVPLTTVRQEFKQLAVAAVGQLVSQIAGQETTRLISVPTTLRLRDSTAQPPSQEKK
ncbi:MAG: LacI family DNA-binding transcriptional regulator [Propionibacteriaceae bacterium]|jgi:DNA-binding LacI/PurR family transcriptional regulator|nr:LacI family DNA-binding transcriptional regulator [Propionibacteriaceae bacterium]